MVGRREVHGAAQVGGSLNKVGGLLKGLVREPLWPKALARWLASAESERPRYLGNVN